MNLAGIEREMARLDAVYRPVATAPVDLADPGAPLDLGASIGAQLAALGVGGRSEAVLRAVAEAYTAGDGTVRAAIRGLFERYPSFRWAAHLPPCWDTAAEFRTRLVLLCAHDQAPDTRDEILALRDLCDRARRAGIDVGPVLEEVATMASDADRYGMGSTRAILLAHSRGAAR
ncbi:hypothetical protein ABT297_31445 [Dactylosporangium sp. NPDC000555]|uniref:hypothetical protein n=1 Tax=Dactylosporangium sp. NPDC000555 TaxID=3154260 RepID=UPI003316F806